ncbi:MAG: acyl carrier protein [Bacteroidetes bacterium HGW-Bacteroidetes-2]|jgi:acyl carrier protein|nr:MAG: acyl carrier protein [Bacteroidetes bacterium HGW-Bacteroidetes-2]
MTEKETYNKLKTITNRYLPVDISKEAIHIDSYLTNELNIKSSNLVDIILDVEDAFNIAISNEDMNELHAVRDAIRIIEGKTK